MAEVVDMETGEIIGEDEYTYEDLSPEVFKFETVGDTIAGMYLGPSTQKVDGQDTSRHDFQTTDGPAFFWGSTVLDGRLQHANVGDFLVVSYTGETEKKYQGGNAAKLFAVKRRVRK